MEKYRFKIRKIIEDDVEIEAKNKMEALTNLIGFVVTKDKKFYKKLLEEKNFYTMFLKEFTNETKKIYYEDNDEVNEDIINYLLDDDKFLKEEFEKISKEIEKNMKKAKGKSKKNTKKSSENEEIFVEKPLEIYCENCGNLISVDSVYSCWEENKH